MNSKLLTNQLWITTKQRLYDPCGFVVTFPEQNFKINDQIARPFMVNNLRVLGFIAKITPKKIGQFVSIWQRDANSITQPQHVDGDFDLMVINCMAQDKGKDNGKFGQFIFPKTALVQYGIISTASKRGKNGMRVYPSWDEAVNKQAITSQAWQLNYFLEIGKNTDLDRAKKLYGNPT